jgi:hypothetical protein
MSLAIVRLSLAARSSRARIKLLENDATNTQKLIHILEQLERQVEDAVVDYIDDDDVDPATPDAAERGLVSSSKRKCRSKPPPEQPIITPMQRKIAASLNRLPIKKERAYFPDVRNSHAMIICRDVKNFEMHKRGEGIVRHWADSFIL